MWVGAPPVCMHMRPGVNFSHLPRLLSTLLFRDRASGRLFQLDGLASEPHNPVSVPATLGLCMSVSMPRFYMAAGDGNSDPHAHSASFILTEPSSQSEL